MFQTCPANCLRPESRPLISFSKIVKMLPPMCLSPVYNFHFLLFSKGKNLFIFWHISQLINRWYSVKIDANYVEAPRGIVKH